ncbi:DUF1833 domain-containing protein [Bosea sp. LjRoot90]|uniref:DUF1833 family protein n=1 Tax=Bosea sp. LjRoot90 TaxID=3342342 RepID=UPI003ECD52A8
MSLSVALEEAYAVNDVASDLLDTIEIDHVTFDEPVRLVRGRRVQGLYETVTLPVPGNPAALFKVVAFDFTRPGMGDGGTVKAKAQINNVSGELHPALRSAIASDQPFSITYRVYSTEDPNNPEIFDGLKMSRVRINAFTAEGDLFFEEIEMMNFPRQIYDLARYAALYGQ